MAELGCFCLHNKRNSVEKTIGANLPFIQELNITRVRKQAGSITAIQTVPPGHKLFQLLPSGGRYSKERKKRFLTQGRHYDEQLQC